MPPRSNILVKAPKFEDFSQDFDWERVDGEKRDRFEREGIHFADEVEVLRSD